MEANTGVCLQIGLNETAEYLRLVDPSYTESEGDVSREIPPHISFNSWKYYGVDCDPCSICKMLEDHGGKDNVEWVVAAINKGVVPHLFSAESWFIGDKEDHPPFYVMSMSFDFLIYSLGLDKIDVLAIDIEGMELPLFRSYSWCIKPQFIAVESHDDQHEELISIITSHGYTITLDEETNIHEGIPLTRELQFTNA